MIQCPKCGVPASNSFQNCSTCGSLIASSASPLSASISKWESRKDALFGTHLSLVKQLLLAPSKLFSQISERSKLSSAVLFYVLLIFITQPIVHLVNSEPSYIYHESGRLGVLFTAFFSPFMKVFFTIPVLFMTSAFFQFLFNMTGITKASYKTTATVMFYCSAPLILSLIPVPGISLFIAAIWTFILQIIGLAKVHKVSKGKMFIIQIIPLMLLILTVSIMLSLLVSTFSLFINELPFKDFLDLVR